MSRLYTFTHFMLSTMAKGIQATHATVELFNKYEKTDLHDYDTVVGANPPIDNSNSVDTLYDWSRNHKTMISLDGGLTPDLHNLIEYFENSDLGLPWAYFEEDESLGGLVTSVAIIVPEKIYATAEALRRKEIVYDPSSKEFRETGGEWSGIWEHQFGNDDVIDFIHKLSAHRMAS